MNEIKLNTIEEAIEDFREGKFIIVVDDEDRENEGDFIIAAEKITPEKVNFMLTHGRGVLCAPITEERCEELDLNMQVTNNTSIHETPFTITVDKLGGGCTTGVSMFDRAETIRALADPKTKPSDLGRRDNGSSPSINGSLPKIRHQDHLYQRPHRLSFKRRIDCRKRRRSKYAYGIRTFQIDPVQTSFQRTRTYRPYKRRMGTGRANISTSPFVLHDRRYIRFKTVRMWRTIAQSDGNDRKRRKRCHRIHESRR